MMIVLGLIFSNVITLKQLHGTDFKAKKKECWVFVFEEIGDVPVFQCLNPKNQIYQNKRSKSHAWGFDCASNGGSEGQGGGLNSHYELHQFDFQGH